MHYFRMNDRQKLDSVPIMRGEGWQRVMLKDIPAEYRELFLRDMEGQNFQIVEGEPACFVHDWTNWLNRRFPSIPKEE